MLISLFIGFNNARHVAGRRREKCKSQKAKFKNLQAQSVLQVLERSIPKQKNGMHSPEASGFYF
jgi:hypothetical protein